MDRNKGGMGSRNQRKMSAHVSSEFFALGTKGNRDESKAKIVPVSNVERKRESSTSLTSTSKKPKLSTPPVRNADTAPTSSNISHELWEQMAQDCEPSELIDSIYSAIEQHDNETVLRLLCGCIKQITLQRPKVESMVYLSISYIAKLCPTLFCNDIITSALLYILRRESNIKSRFGTHAHILASNMLVRGYTTRSQWPEVFMRTYIDDAINERIWVDNDLCSPLVENICATFQTRIPSSSLLQLESSIPSSSAGTSQQHRDIAMSVDDDSVDNSVHGGGDSSATSRISEQEISSDAICPVQNRFYDTQQIIEKYVVDAIKEQLNKRQQQDCYTRNFLKFLCSTSGLSEVRYLCISRLELWIHNGKLVKFAQQLLSYICFNIKGRSVKDQEVLTILVKMRLKTKPLINFYMACIKEMIILQPDILHIVLKLVVQNELSNSRNPNNMGMLATMFQTAPEQSAIHLAEIYKDILLQRDDCLRSLRVFLRELVRMLRFDIDIVQFVKAFLTDRIEISKQIEQFEFRDRVFHSIVDITCLCSLLCVSPQVREASISLRSNRDIKCNPVLLKFYTQMSQIQLDAISWMYEVVPKLYKIQSNDYSQALHKLLLLETADQYSRCDQWPSEPERATLLRMVSETPLHDDALFSIVLIGITKDIPFSIPDTIEIILSVIKRASAMRVIDAPAVQANKYEIVDFLFNMVEYHHPENLKLPENYDPPKLAITVLYWKVMLIMLLISAHNPSTFGSFCWDHYPTMKMLIEMCITNQLFENIILKEELQILALERTHILEFESYLAAQTSQAIITEETSILLSQLMLMDPMGPPRRVPPIMLEQLRVLNKSFRLGHLLCRSRKPDLLLDIIQRQGTTQSMPWLSDLVQNSDGDFNHLPVQCLCEFILFNATNINEENSRDAELVNFLRNLIIEPDSSEQSVCEVLDYIFRRLSSTVKQSRTAALEGLKIIFKCIDPMNESSWLLNAIPQIPHFNEVRSFIIPQLRAACQVETIPELVMSYIRFIASHTINDPVTDMLDHVIDMAQLIVERNTMFQHIVPAVEDLYNNDVEVNDPLVTCRYETLKCLFVMFNNYIIKLRELQDPFELNEYPDLLMVQFNDGSQLPLHVNIIHAFIILLTQSSNTIPESMPILDYWFPLDRPGPIGFLPNATHEPVQLIPDWLKLKMIRSSVDRLIDAALRGLTPDQIVLFVQNFGTPVNSMSKLLALLDHAVNEQFETVKNAILNKAYLAQLIEIQQARGAKNGHFTVQALELHSDSQTVPDLPTPNIQVLESVNMDELQSAVPRNNLSQESSQEIEEIVNYIFNGNFKISSAESRLNDYRFHRIIRQSYNDNKNQSINLLKSLVKLADGANTSCFCMEGGQMQHICTLIRAVVQCKPADDNDSKELVNLLKVVKNKVDNCMHYNSESPSLAIQHFHFSIINIVKRNINLTTEKNGMELEKVKSTRHFKLSCDGGRLIYSITENNKELANIDPLSRDGLLVDWLSDADPELINVTEKLKLDFLFSKDSNDFRYHLLSLICHQTNWSTLISTVIDLLQPSKNIKMDSSTVLNFIEALINNPKLWQGRDKYASKTSQSETIFLLQDRELEAFCQYILDEGETECEISSAKYDYKLCSRINLLFRITNKKGNDLIKFIEYVNRQRYSTNIKLKVILQLYLMCPSIKYIKCSQPEEHSSKLVSLKGCQADKVTNYLITCLGNLSLKKDFDTLSSDTELLMRKLAASHPAIFLRQLGVLSSQIQGRAQLNLRTLREEYHFHRFIQILRTLELLQPMLFNDSYKTELHEILECFFTFFKHHSYVREACHILMKFVEILQMYIHENPSTALLFLEHYVGILMQLSVKFHGIVPLQQLVQGISLLQHKSITSSELNEDETKQEFDLDEKVEPKTNVVPVAENVDQLTDITQSTLDLNNKGAISFAISGTNNKFSAMSPHFMNLIKIIKNSNTEEAILGPLLEIESLTSKRFSFLNELFDRLLELIFSPSAQIRFNAFILLIRHLKYNPGRSDINRCTLNAYIQCLRDDNSSVASTAVDNLAEITILLQEYAVEILSVAFSLGIRSHLNTSTQIKRVMQILMLQHGY